MPTATTGCVAVAGASGALGTHLVTAAVARGHPVVALVRRPPPPSSPLATPTPGLTLATLPDLADVDAVADVLKTHGVAFFLCAVAGRNNAAASDAARRTVEVDLPLALHAAAVRAGCVHRFVLASCPPLACFGVEEKGRQRGGGDAAGVSQPPPRLLSSYLRDKAALLHALRAAEAGGGVSVTVFQVAAWARDALPLAASLRATRLAPVIAGGTSRLQPITDGDLAARVVDGLGRPRDAGATLVVGGPHILTFKELWRAAGRAVGVDPLFVSLPRTVVTAGVLPALRAVGARRPAYLLSLAADVASADLVGEATGVATLEAYLGGGAGRARL